MHDRMTELTAALRASDEKLFPVLRRLLADRGIDSGTSVLVELFSDDREFEYGIVVTRDGAVFQFGLDCMDRMPEDAELIEWIDWTSTYQLAVAGMRSVSAMARTSSSTTPLVSLSTRRWIRVILCPWRLCVTSEWAAVSAD
jgi:hypothetical protein